VGERSRSRLRQRRRNRPVFPFFALLRLVPWPLVGKGPVRIGRWQGRGVVVRRRLLPVRRQDVGQSHRGRKHGGARQSAAGGAGTELEELFPHDERQRQSAAALHRQQSLRHRKSFPSPRSKQVP
jgi:hypothetical protein